MSTQISPDADAADACPVCPPPFDCGPCPAVAIQAAPFGSLTAHACPHCGSSWRTWRDAHGWPVERKLDPISPAQAEANRIALDLALEGGGWGAPRRAA